MRTHRWPYGPCFICVLAPFGRVSVSPSSFGENRRFFIKEVEKPSLSCHQTIIKLRTRMPRFPHRANCNSTRGKVCLLVRPSVGYAFFSIFDVWQYLTRIVGLLVTTDYVASASVHYRQAPLNHYNVQCSQSISCTCMYKIVHALNESGDGGGGDSNVRKAIGAKITDTSGYPFISLSLCPLTSSFTFDLWFKR